MAIIGTAGHVDHGKSTIVQALTGRDPDRWAEEKARGLTIDLGFAWTEIGGKDVGFVDVPGHERFIKNMLAGVGAVDVALFVVAADEGWMPQSEEHLAVLDLLDVRNGVIAITRIDTVDEETREFAELEITEHTAETSLEGWPIVHTAAPSGVGLAELRAALATALDVAGTSADEGRPRLWIDRAFTISGAGTVVTGTLVGGALRRDDELVLWPPGAPVRIRGLQSHERDVDVIQTGNRAALNLAGVERAAIARGAMLGKTSHFRVTAEFLADLRPVRTLEGPLTNRGAYHLHVGSGSWPVQVRFVEDPPSGGASAAIIRTQSPIPLTMGDRLILRDAGRRAVVAGGRVLDPHPDDVRRSALIRRIAALRTVLDAAPDVRADALLVSRGIADLNDLYRDSGGGTPHAGLLVADVAVAAAAVDQHSRKATEHISAYQTENPLRPGAPKAMIASSLGLTVAVLENLIEYADGLVDDGATVRTAAYAPAWGDRQESAWAAARSMLEASGLAVPRASQLRLDDEVYHSLVRDGRLVRVAEDLVYLPAQLEQITTGLNRLPDGFTVADFRDAFEMTRRQAIPVLEWLDGSGWTSRRGDVRTVRKRPSPEPDGAPPL